MIASKIVLIFELLASLAESESSNVSTVKHFGSPPRRRLLYLLLGRLATVSIDYPLFPDLDPCEPFFRAALPREMLPEKSLVMPSSHKSMTHSPGKLHVIGHANDDLYALERHAHVVKIMVAARLSRCRRSAILIPANDPPITGYDGCDSLCRHGQVAIPRRAHFGTPHQRCVGLLTSKVHYERSMHSVIEACLGMLFPRKQP